MTDTAPDAHGYADFVVKHGTHTYTVSLPLSSTVEALKAEIASQSSVPVGKQRLFLQKPVEKRFSKDAPGATPLSELFSESLIRRVASHQGTAPQHIHVDAMLIGNAQGTAELVDSKATSEMARLVSTTLERDEMWFRCSYAKGYLRQTAYICRTCVNEKRALPDHAMCLACSEVCHHDHDVEEWGVRYHMRCDCCTSKCWRVPNVARQVESATDADGVTTTTQPGQATTVMPADLELRMQRHGGTTGESERRPIPPLTALQPQECAATAVAGDEHERDRHRKGRKRSRSSSPLTPKRTAAGGLSPMSGIRIAPASGPSPFGLQQPPANEQHAIQSPLESFPTLPALPPPHIPMEADEEQTTAPHAEGVDSANRDTVGVSALLPATEETSPVKTETAQPTSTSTATKGDIPSEAMASTSQIPFQRCQFVLDSATMRPMERSVLPVNKYNRYPRDPLHWCYCKDDHPTDSPDCGGVVCMLCTTCYWSTHLTRLNADAYRRMPCYGDVIQGDTLAFWCKTCNTYVCTSCRYRCHKDHQVNDEYICPAREDGTDNGAPAGVNFSCGCRGLCVIAESVPEVDVDDTTTYSHVPNEVAIELMNNDVFTGFVCATCLEEHPWILSEDPKKCWNGQLPEKKTETRLIVPCATPEAASVGGDVVPYHGAIFPVNLFYEDATCPCEACRAAFHAFAPRAAEDATEMVMQLHNECDKCGKSVKHQRAFICQTCDVSLGETYFLCADCNEVREQRLRQLQAQDGSATGASVENDPNAYTHDLSHVFVEDTLENLSALCGMQFLNALDEPSRQYVVNNWDEVQENYSVTTTLTDTFGQVPIQFTKEEQDAFLDENKHADS